MLIRLVSMLICAAAVCGDIAGWLIAAIITLRHYMAITNITVYCVDTHSIIIASLLVKVVTLPLLLLINIDIIIGWWHCYFAIGCYIIALVTPLRCHIGHYWLLLPLRQLAIIIIITISHWYAITITLPLHYFLIIYYVIIIIITWLRCCWLTEPHAMLIEILRHYYCFHYLILLLLRHWLLLLLLRLLVDYFITPLLFIDFQIRH